MGVLRSTALAFLLVAGCASAQESFWSFLPSKAPIVACADNAAVSAEAALDQLNKRIEALRPTDSWAGALEQVHALLRTECFHLASESPRLPRPDSSAALIEWWNAGGRAWLSSYLERPLAGPIEAPLPQVVVPPDVRKTLGVASQQRQPLARYLCPPSDEACGAETRGWKARAETAFQNHHSRGLFAIDASGPFEYTLDTAASISRACAPQGAGTTSEAYRYAEWRECIERHRISRMALPLGETRAPVSGWLLLEGRRGHYEFCDTVRAFDLATGAAFAWDSCSGLALSVDGSVDRKLTDEARTESVRRGTVATEHIREAAWMLLLRGEIEVVQLSAEWFPLPPGLHPALPAPPTGVSEPLLTGVAWSSAQTTLTWRLVMPDRSALSGNVTWPESYDAAEDHAAALLNIAELGLVEGCAGSAPTAALLRTTPPQALNEPLDGADAMLDARFLDAATRWRALQNCRIRRQR